MSDICLINYTGSKGGGAQYSYELTKALISLDVSVIAIISRENENISEWKKLKLEKLIIIETYKSVSELMFNSVFWVRNKKIILKELDGYNIKNIICPMITFWTKRINKLIPSVNRIVVLHDVIAHSKDLNKKAIKAFGETKILKSANHVVVLSDLFTNDVKKIYGKNQNQISYIPMGTTNLYKNVNKKISSVKYDNSKINFLFFGTISHYKGINILAEAYRNVAKNIDNVSLTIAGSGDFNKYSKLYKGIKNVHIINRWIKDEEVESFFNDDSVVVVLPYIDATQSGVIPLAVSYGVPFIASNTGGISEQVKSYNTGILVPPGDSKKLASAMIEIAGKKNVFYEHKRRAKLNSEKFSWVEIAKEFINLMD